MLDTCADFFIAGAPRCGTTSLAYFLRAHSEVCFSSPKETHYFLSSALDASLERDPQRHYIQRFFPHRNSDSHRVMGEGSVSYLYFPHVSERILALNPAARFIVMLRNPMQMVPSFHRRMLYLLEEDTEDFAQAWALQEARARGECVPRRCLMPLLLQYSEVGKLGKYVSQLLERVPRSQCLFILHDDLSAHPGRVAKAVREFLGLEPSGKVDFEIRLRSKNYRHRWLQQLIFKPPGPVLRLALNSDARGSSLFGTARRMRQRLLRYNTVRAAGPPLSPEMCAVLRATFREDSQLLGERVGRDLSHWYEGPEANSSADLSANSPAASVRAAS